MGLFTFVIYTITRAPTFSFWDCGEFVACAKILGIPHPPGTPLFVLLGRVFTLLPYPADVGAQVNMLSVVTSAGAAVFAFFVLFRVIQGALNDSKPAPWKVPVTYLGAITGTLCMAFSRTHWNNAVETEVYGPSMFVIMALLWLTLRWMDSRQTKTGSRYLIAIVYITFAAIGIHLTAFLVFPCILAFVLIVDRSIRTDWRMWISFAVLLTAAASFDLFGQAWIVWTIVSIVGVIIAKQKQRWALVFLLLAAAFIGYTNHLYIPIRSTHDPNIDENNPETFASFRYFLARKQYGSQDMITRMFSRRGSWENQFGNHPRMGFWYFFKDQYGITKAGFIIAFALGIFGCLWLARRRRNFAFLLVSLLLIGSVGLVLYMNFADGTRYDPVTGDAYMEVRDRDYFFTAGYAVFGMMMGVGVAGALSLLFGAQKRPVGRSTAWIGAVVLLLPLYQLQSNYHFCDRTGDYSPWDYAYNMLNTCEENSILFTAGDNDTFPLWCLQDAYGIRQDINVVNLSLANTDWYNLQMKNKWGLPVTWSDEQIIWTETETVKDTRGRTLELYYPSEKIYDPISKSYEYLSPYKLRRNEQTGGTLRVQDVVVEHILSNNKWQRPVYFSGPVGDKSRLNLDQHYVQTGILNHIVKRNASGEIDPELNAAILGDTCQYRGLSDMSIYRNESTLGNWMIYPEKFLQLAQKFRELGDTTRSLAWAQRATESFPYYWRGPVYWADFEIAMGDTTAGLAILAEYEQVLQKLVRENPGERYYHLSYGMMLERLAKPEAARVHLIRAYHLNPSDGLTFQTLLLHCRDHGLNELAVKAAKKWLEYYPNDEMAHQIVAYGGVG